MRMNHLVAIVTGGASGFGEGICRAYAREGARVVVADLDEARGELVAEDIRASGAEALFCHVDVSRSADMQRLTETAIARYGRLDVMVNNAGLCHRNQPMLSVGEEEFDRLLQVNVKSIYLSAVSCVPVFRRQGGGVFVNVASTGGVRPRPGLTWYNGTKGAVILLTKSMAVELAPDRIRVNVINPALGETGMLATAMGVEDNPENRARFTASIPLGRLSRPVDVANAAVFLAEPTSEFITGVCLEVDGGRCV
jgi:3-oxoacyl-[acyl-carrier protein] reductase